MPYTTLDLTLQPPVARITLHPEIPSASTLVDEIDAAAEAISGTDDIRVALLALPESPANPTADDTPPGRAFRSLELMPQPVIAAVEGAIEGVLLELVLSCDVRVAAEATTFCIATAAGGDAITLGGTQRLPRLIGRGRASQMILLGERVDATTALAWGLVNAIAPQGAALNRAEEIAASVAARGPLAVRYAKEAISRGPDMSLEQALRYETDLTITLQTTSDRAEGVRAFLEKRKPRFNGD
jgi:enoyl-CoA hydratase/carnithine racemase